MYKCVNKFFHSLQCAKYWFSSSMILLNHFSAKSDHRVIPAFSTFSTMTDLWDMFKLYVGYTNDRLFAVFQRILLATQTNLTYNNYFPVLLVFLHRNGSAVPLRDRPMIWLRGRGRRSGYSPEKSVNKVMLS